SRVRSFTTLTTSLLFFHFGGKSFSLRSFFFELLCNFWVVGIQVGSLCLTLERHLSSSLRLVTWALILKKVVSGQSGNASLQFILLILALFKFLYDQSFRLRYLVILLFYA